MREEHIKLIKEACIKANPEIVELKFGCKLFRHYKDLKDSGKTYFVLERTPWRTEDSVHITSVPFGTMTIEMDKDKIENGGEFEIIGRDIRLADIFVVLQDKLQKYPETNIGDKAMCLIVGGTRFMAKKVSWDLFHDNLEDQSDECLEFIYNLIK